MVVPFLWLGLLGHRHGARVEDCDAMVAVHLAWHGRNAELLVRWVGHLVLGNELHAVRAPLPQDGRLHPVGCVGAILVGFAVNCRGRTVEQLIVVGVLVGGFHDVGALLLGIAIHWQGLDVELVVVGVLGGGVLGDADLDVVLVGGIGHDD